MECIVKPLVIKMLLFAWTYVKPDGAVNQARFMKKGIVLTLR